MIFIKQNSLTECGNPHSSFNPRKYIKVLLIRLEFYGEIK